MSGAKQLAQRVQEDMFQTLELKCSIGVGRNKLLAKLASQHCKPFGTRIVEGDGDAAEILGTTPCYKLPGCGGKLKAKFVASGVGTAATLQLYSTSELQEAFGVTSDTAALLFQQCRGKDLSTVVNVGPPSSVQVQMSLAVVPRHLPSPSGKMSAVLPIRPRERDRVEAVAADLCLDLVQRVAIDAATHKRHPTTLVLTVYCKAPVPATRSQPTKVTSHRANAPWPCLPDDMTPRDAQATLDAATSSRLQRQVQTAVVGLYALCGVHDEPNKFVSCLNLAAQFPSSQKRRRAAPSPAPNQPRLDHLLSRPRTADLTADSSKKRKPKH